MSDTINLAGKDIIVDHVTTQDGSDALSALQLMNAKRNRNGVNAITGGTCRIGARANGTALEVYAYNPLNSYSSDFGDDYYVNTGYVDCNGQSCPVYIPGKHISFPVTGGQFKQGTWAIVIYKATALDEVWSVKVAIPEPDNSTPPVMAWSDTLGGSVPIDANVWVIGSFVYNYPAGGSAEIINLFVNQSGTTPSGFLNDRFLQVMNDCDGTDTTDFTNWATAMRCDQIFRRLAALELFVNELKANDAMFNSIRVTGNSILEGQVDNDAFTTFPSSSGSPMVATLTPERILTRINNVFYHVFQLAYEDIISGFGTTGFAGLRTKGTVVIDGVTFTGTDDDPFTMNLTVNYDSQYEAYSVSEFSISGGDIDIEDYNGVHHTAVAYDESGIGGVRAPSLKAPVATPPNVKGAITAVNLQEIASLGGAETHDMVPKTPAVDTIGKSTKPYHEIYGTEIHADKVYGEVYFG